MTDITELAALIVQNDFMRAEADDAALRAAREAERRAQAEEVAALHDAADAIAVQAWVRGGAAAAGGLAQCGSAVSQVGSESATHLETIFEKGGAALSSVAEPAGQLLGGVPKADADADAAEARNTAKREDDRADDAAQHRDRVLRHAESVFDLVEGVQGTEHQTNLAILGNF